MTASGEGKPKRFPLALNDLAPTRAVTPARELLRPQRHAQLAVADAARIATPRGLGLDSAGVRLRMVQRLQEGGLQDERVLRALAQVPRHEFVDSALAFQAYEDTSLPIGHGQTISKPSVVGRMLELLMQSGFAQQHGHLGRVLEIGTGCGYQAAILAQLARSVLSIERLAALHEKAKENLRTLMGAKFHLLHGDGCLGHAAHAPFDTIIAAAGGDELPAPWLSQLSPGGRLVAPMAAPSGKGQVLVVVDRLQDAGGAQYVRSIHEAVLFVPLKSGLM